MKKYKKYTLEQKIDYWKKQLDHESDKISTNKINKPTSRHLYASGFLTTSKNGVGLSSNFNKQDKSHKLGQLAGLKANIIEKK